MKKKVLTKQILLALAMAAVLPAANAWAKELDNTPIIVTSGEHTYELSSDVEYTGSSTWLTNMGGKVTITGANSLSVITTGCDGINGLGISVETETDIKVKDIFIDTSTGDRSAISLMGGFANNEINITSSGAKGNQILSGDAGVYVASDGNASVSITAESGSNKIQALTGAGIDLNAGTVVLNAWQGSNEIEANAEGAGQINGFKAIGVINGNVELNAQSNKVVGYRNGICGVVETGFGAIVPENILMKTLLVATNGNNEVIVRDTASTQLIHEYAINAVNNYEIELLAEKGNNLVWTEGNNEKAIDSEGGLITLIAKNDETENIGNNIVSQNAHLKKDIDGKEKLFGDKYALYATTNNDGDIIGRIQLTATGLNELRGSASAESGSQISLLGHDNIIRSVHLYDQSDDAYYFAVKAMGGISSAENDDGESNQNVSITAEGGVNIITSLGNGDLANEKTVFATEGGSIAINGTSLITAGGAWGNDTTGSSYKKNDTSAALIAGTYDWETSDTVDTSTISLNYGAGSAVTGDIVAGKGGVISVTEQSNTSGINTMADGPAITIYGNALAANGGSVTLELGEGSVWYGRADDYQDAAVAVWGAAHVGEFTQVFSNGIQSTGTVNVSLGQNATWDVMGQSWVSTLHGKGSTIILNGEKTGGNALHIGELTGENTFVMNVRPGKAGDMLYVKDGTAAGQQHLVINNAEEVLSKLAEGKRVRFATVSDAGTENFDESHVSAAGEGTFGRSTRIEGEGAFNVNFDVDYVDYHAASEQDAVENDAYNGGSGKEGEGNVLYEEKPGTAYVDKIYGSEETAQNVYLVRRGNTMEDLSNAGRTILSMSKVNYSNAVYMDRLNKRMGEARYIDGDDGLWVRMRHDRIGKDDAFRSMNTMFELGYDWQAKGQQDGEHRQGVAFDYMRGTADYQNVAGDGDVRRAGVWLYDTWLGDKGHYSDYVVKYGRLSNDFDIYSERGDKIDGDYDNDVWSVSAEYGRKKDIGNDWYFEPQVQAQYAYVTSADYTTSQGTKVELDGIDSLIGRAGFRLGRDTSEGNTVYFKADILHEFLGDQSIRAMDDTGVLSTTYENEGTWYDVGFGFSHRMGEDSYLFLDVEHSFGNDNEDTYQVNIGLNRAF